VGVTPSQLGLVSSTFFLNSSRQLTWELYSIGLPDLTRLAYSNLALPAYPNSTRAPYPSLTRSHQCLPGLIHSYPVELPYMILFLMGLLLTQPHTVLRGQTTLPDSSPDQTSTYQTLPYPISSQPDICLPDRTRPPYSTSIPSKVTPRCSQLLTQPYPITLPDRVPSTGLS
jgi:hypothetical protein